MFDIDFVVTWVDGNDKNWVDKKNETPRNEYSVNNSDEDSRFRDMQIFTYWFRAVEKYTPWVHKVYLITDNQVPEWLKTENSKLEVVDHKDILDENMLPTFNSNAIELSINNIASLSEHFVLFNDDVFINKPMKPTDFFDKDGNSKDAKSYNFMVPTTEFQRTPFNSIVLINKLFKKEPFMNDFWRLLMTLNLKPVIKHIATIVSSGIPGYYDYHVAISYKKSNFDEVSRIFYKDWQLTRNAHFRSQTDISHWLVRYYQLEKKQYSFRNPRKNRFYSIDEVQKIVKDIKLGKHFLIDINDSDDMNDDEFNENCHIIASSFQEKLPNKSSFEK